MSKNQTVIGSYQTETETEQVIKRLQSEGYKKEDITLFTSHERSEELNNPRGVDVANPDVDGTDEDHNNDRSFWESLKDAFKVRDDEYYNDPNYVEEDDLLHMYRDDLRKGHIVVVVDEDNDETDARNDAPVADHPTDTQLDTLGTTAGFPEEGSVQGMGDGGQRPLEPNSNDGTPPELEDTHGEADVSEATEDRLRQERRNK
ncbi:hypothetical protein GCM10008932_10350 [Alkalibacterium iburiense]|uniref:General stress protein 17M-like domain-containing protein n=1 Tax=Alkalibacterium iburiense TaxID=290589 RepID=A0ABN0XAZ5_9LACT